MRAPTAQPHRTRTAAAFACVVAALVLLLGPAARADPIYPPTLPPETELTPAPVDVGGVLPTANDSPTTKVADTRVTRPAPLTATGTNVRLALVVVTILLALGGALVWGSSRRRGGSGP